LSVYLQRGVVRFVDVEEKRTNATSQDLSRYQVVDPGDFVLNNQQAWRGSVGVSRFAGIVSPAYLVLSLSEDFLSGYANFLFRDQSLVAQYLICSKGVGTIQRNLYWPHLKRVEVVMPPPADQAAVVRFLNWANGRLERAIRSKRKVIALLNEQKQAIIHGAVTRGLDPNVSLKPSGIPWLGDIPANWVITRACRLFRQVARYDIAGNEPKMSMSRRYGLVRSEHLSNRAAQAATNIKFSVCEPGDLVLNKYQAHNGLFSAAQERGLITSNYSVFKPIDTGFTEFYALLFSSALYRNEFRMLCQGVGDGMMPLYSSAFLKTPTLSPPAPEQQKIVSFIAEATTSLSQTVSRLEREIELLIEYRTRLVGDIVTGKFDVREAATNLPEDISLVTNYGEDSSEHIDAIDEEASE